MQAALEQLGKPVQYLKGVGPQRSTLLERLGIETVEDLLYHVPRGFQDRSHLTPIGNLKSGGEYQYVIGEVVSVKENIPKSQKVRHIFKAILKDTSGSMTAVWFNQKHVSHSIAPGTTLALYGNVEFDRQQAQMLSPDWEIIYDEDDDSRVGIIPMYPLTEGLGQKAIRSIILDSLRHVREDLPDWLPELIRTRRTLLRWSEAIQLLHFPGGHLGSAPNRDYRSKHEMALRRLAYDELFMTQLSLALSRVSHMEKPGISHVIKVPIAKLSTCCDTSSEGVCARFLTNLPFTLTMAQVRAMSEIEKDMASSRPMYRLLQGDVGSGKTVVLLYGMLIAAENARQSALMAPTEVLAQQHYDTILKLTQGLNISVALLHGGLAQRDSRETREAIAKGKVSLVVGTHALFQEKTDFAALSMVVVDEQHKFGVGQRQAIQGKGFQLDMLVTSATPIPRTLALAAYGDLDVSVLDEKPAGRLPVRTHWVPERKRMDAYHFIESKIENGAQVYVIAPLIEESEALPTLNAVQERYQHLAEVVFPHRAIGLLHGRLPSAEKQSLLTAFSNGDLDVLVSTTVIEVGVDVPRASVMLVESAERFGLAQLHQLRGRVGRGNEESYCLLMTGAGCSEAARKRLRTLEKTNDGFQIAEADLELRGPGELMGYRQSGLLGFRIADLQRDRELLLEAREDACALVKEDPTLRKPVHSLLRRRWESLPRRQVVSIG